MKTLSLTETGGVSELTVGDPSTLSSQIRSNGSANFGQVRIEPDSSILAGGGNFSVDKDANVDCSNLRCGSLTTNGNPGITQNVAAGGVTFQIVNGLIVGVS